MRKAGGELGLVPAPEAGRGDNVPFAQVRHTDRVFRADVLLLFHGGGKLSPPPRSGKVRDRLDQVGGVVADVVDHGRDREASSQSSGHGRSSAGRPAARDRATVVVGRVENDRHAVVDRRADGVGLRGHDRAGLDRALARARSPTSRQTQRVRPSAGKPASAACRRRPSATRKSRRREPGIAAP